MLTRNYNPNQHSKQTEPFDALAFEEERYQIFQQTERTYQAPQGTPGVLSSSTPVPSSAFLDGRWDGWLNEQPTADQYNQPGYREGYLDGVAFRLDEKFGLVA